jgi:iron(III) transport system ATP-binding protein
MIDVLELKQVSIRLNGQLIVNEVSLRLAEGTIGCLLGASGCGKTTLLRGIAGFEAVSGGSIHIDGQPVSAIDLHKAAEQRKVGLVFQDYALFPHLSVAGNIGFGLQALARGHRETRIDEVARLLKITDLLDAWPHRLSGGQQQRVAIARAIAPRPRILLLDEPFSAMDVGLREQIAREMRHVLRQDGITAVLVSHNQHEAFAMADQIGIMQTGNLLQWDTPFRVYHQPVDPYVASFVGEGVLLNGSVRADGSIETELGQIDNIDSRYVAGSRVVVLIRPDDIVHTEDSSLQAVLIEKSFRGASWLYTLGLESGARVLSLVPAHHEHQPGEKIGLRLDLEHHVVFPSTVDNQR